MPRKKKQRRQQSGRDTNEKRARRFLAENPKLDGTVLFRDLMRQGINISAARVVRLQRELRGKKAKPSSD
jgi:hypothetical protein